VTDTDGIPPDDGRGRSLPARWLRRLAVATGTTVLGVSGVAWLVYTHLDGNIRTDHSAEAELARHAAERPPPGAGDAQNVLIIGTDSRRGANAVYGRDSGTQRSDTVILLHLSGGRRDATAVSIPRDLMVPMPSCTEPDGRRTAAQHAQFNSSFEWGGVACTIRTVEQLTGIRVNHYLIIDFTGFKRMVDAVDGVRVCVAEPMRDGDARLDLPAGRQVLGGDQALGYVRSRHAFGDGSDTERISRQQDFLASLVRKVKSDGVLFDPVKLYPVLNAATESVVADPGLDSLNKLYDLVASVRHTPDSRIRFLTVPREPYADDPNRDQLVEPQAEELFAALRADRPVVLRRTAAPVPSAAPVSTDGLAAGTAWFTGTSADHDTCGR
jgi:LCP family protein required for cell wall assembly